MMAAISTLLIFLFVVLLVTFVIVRYHLPPFLPLVGAAIMFSLLAGMADEMVPLITKGIGSIFSLLGIPIFCGAVIAQVLKQGGFLPRIVADLRRGVRQPGIVAAISGYLLSIPLMCCITPFIILSPLVEHLHEGESTTNKLLHITAIGSVISFVLLFPLPVVYAVVQTTQPAEFPVDLYTIIALVLSSAILLAILLLSGTLRRSHSKSPARDYEAPAISPWRAWAPALVPIALIILGTLFESIRIIGNINIALLVGVLIALLLVNKEIRISSLGSGTKNAGMILFDLCGAGALGSVIAASPFASEMYAAAGPILPGILLPFVLAALIQTAQGSRVVTAVVTSTILAGTVHVSAIPPVILILLISAGTLVVSYVSDPYFWLIKRTTGDDLAVMVRWYTLPLALAGMVILASSLVLSTIL